MALLGSVLLMSALLAQAAPAGVDTQAELTLVVFEQELPLSGVEVRLGGQRLGQTDGNGALRAKITPGRADLVLIQGGDTRMKLDLLTDTRELVQIIVTLQAGQAPIIDIESSGERKVAVAEAKTEKKQPPGALVGQIISAEDQKPVKQAALYFSGSEVEVQTDAQGRFAVELPGGLYAVSVVHPRFATQTQENVRVIPSREVTLKLELTPAGIAMQDYVVTAPYVEGSIASVMAEQRKASAVSEVLGAEQMAATGDSNAASALKRVSGLTIEDGKYVLVRGQPYRYTFTLWNGSPLPSPEPLLRIVPLDLFPTGVLSGIEVQKSFTADRPGEFGSGLIDLKTRGSSDRAFLNFGVSTSYDSESSFRSGYSYQGGSWDWLGYDDGGRALPKPVEAASQGGKFDIDDLPEARQQELGRSFSNRYRIHKLTLPPDLGVSVAGGGGFDLPKDGSLGAVASVKWGQKWRRQARRERNFALDGDELVERNNLLKLRTNMDADIGGLLTVTAAWDKHELSSNTFFVHQSQQRTTYTTGFLGRSQKGDVQDYTLSWLERQLVVQQLVGEHNFDWMELSYRGSLAFANRDAPDRRSYAYLDEEGGDVEYFLFGNSLTREYDTVDDSIMSFGVDAVFPILDEEKDAFGLKLKTGVFASAQKRDTNRRIFAFLPKDEEGANLRETNPEVLFNPANTGPQLGLDDFSSSTRDDSTGSLDVLAGYVLGDLRLKELLRLTAGVRYEIAKMDVITFRLTPVIEEGSSQAVRGAFDQANLLPSLGLTWFLAETMQVKAAYGRTTSRPNLNELSNARFFDPDSGDGFVGDLHLKPAIIDGVDFRWEWYPSPTESLSVGGFWKHYQDPIERTFLLVGGSDPLGTFRNAERADVWGVEVGGRVEASQLNRVIDDLPEFVDDIYLMANAALMWSEVDLGDGGVNTRSKRPLDGQAGYMLNLQAGYSGEVHDISLAYNLVGRRLSRAGVQGQPDVYQQPVGRLDASWRMRLWDDDDGKGSLRITGGNLLNPRWVWKQGDKTWRSYQTGLSIGASLDVKFQ